MKKLLLILLAFSLFSCSEQYTEGPFTYDSKVINKFHSDSYDDYGMHYGYSVTKRKMCYHMGHYTVDAVNKVQFLFLGDTVEVDGTTYYNALNGDIKIIYEKMYLITKEDTVFRRNRILEIKNL